MYHGKFEKKRRDDEQQHKQPDTEQDPGSEQTGTQPDSLQRPTGEDQNRISEADAQRRIMERRQARYRRAQRRKRIIIAAVAVLVVALGILFFVKSLTPEPEKIPETNLSTTQEQNLNLDETATATGSSVPSETTAPTEPYVTATASVGVTGDILMHTPVLNAAKTSDGEYDFNDNYTYVKEYFSGFDLMIANLEITLGGTDAGAYVGYPIFNCPDSVIDALQAAGIDLLLTANNHTYDTGYDGLIRTQEVLNEKGMPHIGTRLSEDDPNYIVRDINGIKVGMVCYTYESGKTSDGRKTLNGNPLKAEACALVSSFDYNDLDSFYEEVEDTLQAMGDDGAEATMVFIHWGEEYQLSPNSYQETIAQQLCELGVDVIVGGHPHVLQPFDTLTSSSGHETYCIYSVGNAVSNQRREKISRSPNGHTEDGMIFELEFEKWSDGTVDISSVDILPTWVNLDVKDGKNVYSIIPLDTSVKSWDVFDVSDASDIYESYERTMSVVGDGLNECREALGLSAIPASITQ